VGRLQDRKFRRFLLILLLIWVLNVPVSFLVRFPFSITVKLLVYAILVILYLKVDSAVEQQNNISPLIFYNYKIYDV